MAKVLCIDDDEVVARLVAEVVEFCGHSPIVETDAVKAAGMVREQNIAAVLSDYMMPRLDGIDILVIWQQSRPSVRRVLITAAPHEAEVRDALRSGVAQMVIAKPPGIADIKMALAWL